MLKKPMHLFRGFPRKINKYYGEIMKFAKLIAWIGLSGYDRHPYICFTTGDFNQDGGEIIANPWGKVSLVDLYVGFILFSAWIIFREKSLLISIIWVILMMILGYFTASLYVLIHLYRSKGDWLDFFLGWRRSYLLANIKNKGEKSMTKRQIANIVGLVFTLVINALANIITNKWCDYGEMLATISLRYLHLLVMYLLYGASFISF